MKKGKTIPLYILTVTFLFSTLLFAGVLLPGQNSHSQKNTRTKTVSGSRDSVRHKEKGDPKGMSGEGELVVPVHGFFRTHRDMSFLRDYFTARGYSVFTPGLPTTFGSLEKCTVKLERELGEINGDYERIHFVGHSMGGLIIRYYLSKNKIPEPGRCVLIGIPNKGTDLAGLFAWCPPLTWVVKPLKVLRPGGVEIPPPLNSPQPEMAAIAGSGEDLFSGRFISGDNDGRVPAASVPFDGMKEIVVLPYHHNEIHHIEETAELVHRFLQEGAFGTRLK